MNQQEEVMKKICKDISSIAAIRTQIDTKILPVIKMEKRAYDVVELFHSLYSKGGDNECWNWEGYVNPVSGYGVLHAGAKAVFAGIGRYTHRIAWYLATGTKPPKGRKIHIMHTCDNPSCVNPAHLVLGTSGANHGDAVKKGRKKPGERKLHTRDVEWIRSHYNGPDDLPAIAEKYDVCAAYIYRIAIGHSRSDGLKQIPVIAEQVT